MNALNKIVVIAIAGLLVGASAQAQVLYDFESGGQGWGSFGPITTDSGLIATGSSGQGRFHSADFNLAGWGMIDVSPATDLSAFTGLSLDARFGDITGFPPFTGSPAMDIGIEINTVEYYAPAVVLTGDYITYSVNFADFVPGGSDLSSAIIKLRMLKGSNGGVGLLEYDQVVGIPEPMSLMLLGLGALLLRRR